MNQRELPFKISVSFEMLIDQYKDRYAQEEHAIVKAHLKNLLDYFEGYPELTEGIRSVERLKELKEPISLLLGDLFPKALTLNEIKSVMVPFQQIHFNYSQRFRNILDDAGDDFELKLLDFTDDQMYIMACNIILGAHYMVDTSYKKPFYYNIPDKNGVIKTYKLAINADFVQVLPTSKSKELTQDDIDELLQSYDEVEIWKEKFPPHSWEFKGFTIVSLTDVTVDTIISDMKSNMLSHTTSNDGFEDFEKNFQRLFNNNEDIKIGFTKYDKDTDQFVASPGKAPNSFILNKQESLSCDRGLCDCSYDHVIKKHEYLAIADIEKALNEGEDNKVLQIFLDQGIKSCIIVPIVAGEELIGTLEIVSPNKNDLNTINANKLDDILPYIITTAERSVQESENHIKAIIQNECTSIHPTVLWKFEEEAERFFEDSLNGKETTFKDVVFDYVYPLFGQIDIIGSSTARNNAIQADFIKQLDMVKNIFVEATKHEELAFYEQMMHRISLFAEEFKSSFNTASEEQLLHFLKNEINPIMPHVRRLSEALNKQVETYEKAINIDTGIIYEQRKDYEDTVQRVNENMALMLDKKQVSAQKVYPHFFERFKTDGVEHNMYIGESLVKNKPFNKVYLNNLKLWQLMTMCEMENEFYNIQNDLPLQLSCASLLLVFSNSLSIRYRVDEKKFDVDGSYNARYEIIKKRIDKAHIKGTDERITQKGKLVIVYSQKKDELEYLRYINFLQSKNYVENNVELVELEDLQGVVGLKAIRVDIVYNPESSTITYDDLVKEIEK